MKVVINLDEDHERYIFPYDLEKRPNQITSRGVLRGSGTCRVAYNSKEYNEFSFANAEEFRYKFLPCVERDLLKFMGVIK